MFTRGKISINRVKVLALICLAMAYCGITADKAQAKPAKPGLPGVWVLDVEASKAIQPPPKKPGFFSGIGKSTSVSIGGIPLPKSNTAKVPETSGRSNDPEVIFCTGMTFSADDKTVRIDYDGLGAKTFTIGKYRGRKTAYNGKIMNTSYESNSRKVSQKYVLDDSNRMIVTIILNPKSSPKNVIKKVFNRSTAGEAMPR